MSEPRRWLNDPELSPELRTLLEAGEAPPELPLAERRRLGRFVTRVSAGLFATSLLFTSKVVAALLVVSVSSVATWQVVKHVVVVPAASGEPAARPRAHSPAKVNPSPSRLEVNLPQAPVEVNVEPPPVEVKEPAVAPSEPRPPKPASHALPPPPSDPLAAEAEVLLRARALLDADPSAALAAAAQHARSFASGQLAAERELIAIDALGRLGKRADARQRATALIESQPGSMYVRRARHLADLD